MAELAPSTANAAAMAARGEGEALDDDAPLFGTDDFRMFCMKIQPCAKRYVHDWVTCPFSHPGEKAKRRDPRYFVYTGIACPSMKKAGACPRGEKCPYAHNVFEYWLHPTRYRTQLCNDGMGCRRRVCFFAHSLAQLRVPATKPFVPPEVLAALEAPQANSPAAMAAVSDAMKRISDSWQAGSHRADEQQPRPSEAAQIESRVLEHLYGGAPADHVVQQLQAAREDTLAANTALQARLAGALAAMKRSRSADDGQDALIQVLQGMLNGAARQQDHHQHDDRMCNGSGSRTSSAGNLWEQQQYLQQAHATQFQQLHNTQLYAGGGHEQAIPARSVHSLPSLRENSVVPDGGGAVLHSSSGMDLQQAGIYPAKLQTLLGSVGPSSTNSYSHSLGSRPLTPTAAEYTSWVANGGGSDSSHRRSLQQDSRPGPSRGHYPRRRSLQVEDWRARPNPFARASDWIGLDVRAFAPVPLQGFVGADQAGAYNNMFDGSQPTGAAGMGGADAAPSQAMPYAPGAIQSTFLHPAPGSPGELHFPARWPAQQQQPPAPRGSLDSIAPRAGGYSGDRQSIEVQPRPTADVYAQRLSLDANMLRGSDGGSSSLSRGSNSNDYVMSVKYGADLQAQGSGDQLGPLPTQAQLRRSSHSPANKGSKPGTPAQQAAMEEQLTAQLGQLYLQHAPAQRTQA